ncbi:MAG: ABC transporter substrate-binding protein [Synergistaceae bacterium]|jgi:peptide/nickel transport system substrate-binding protein|nr:ABC transporter substrate-binding protein [Synergistaceae bacterium]
MKRNLPVLLVFLLFAVNSIPVAAQGAELSDFIFGTYTFSKIDPADKYNGWATIRYGVGETLFKLDENLKVVPVLVEAYKLSEDTRTWTLTLRDGVMFHNGNTMNGVAVKASLERLIAVNERAASDLMIESISAEGNTVAITTTVPNPTLLNALCDPYACIVDASADNGKVDFNMYPVGTGPYVIKEYVPDDKAYLEPFAKYWGGAPKSKSVTVKAIPDVDTLALAMQNGEVDAAYGLSYDTLTTFSNDDRFNVMKAATTRVYMLYFNLEREWMKDRNFRRAICMAVDKKSYGAVLLNGAGTATKAAFPSSLSYGNDDLFPDVPSYDPEGAKALLTESGYTDSDGDGFLDKDGKKVSVKLLTYGRAGLPQSAQAFQSALTELGIGVDYEQVDSVDQHLRSGNFDICTYAYVTTPTGDPFSYLNFTMGTGKGANFGRYSNPEVDRLLSEMASEFEGAKRADYAVKIQRIATSDSSYCYMFHLNMFMVTKLGVTGIIQSPVDYYHITAETSRGSI